MEIDRKAEVLFILIILLMIPTLYLFTESLSKAKYKIKCTPVIYADAGIPGEEVENLEKNDTKICSMKCNNICMVTFGRPCKGVHHAIYSEIYGVSCVCELYKVDREFADDCIDEEKELVNESKY